MAQLSAQEAAYFQRRGYVIPAFQRYAPTTSVFERNLPPVDGTIGGPVNFAMRPICLLRGVERGGRNNFAVGHSR